MFSASLNDDRKWYGRDIRSGILMKSSIARSAADVR
jgi:hypothetical protein